MKYILFLLKALITSALLLGLMWFWFVATTPI